MTEIRAGWYDARHPRRTTRPTVAEARTVGTPGYVFGFVARMLYPFN